MDNVKYGIVGLGNMGRAHRENILSGKVKGFDLTAICDVSGSLPDKIKGESQFTDVDEMINSGLIDAIHICTPHPSHKEIGIKELEKVIKNYLSSFDNDFIGITGDPEKIFLLSPSWGIVSQKIFLEI